MTDTLNRKLEVLKNVLRFADGRCTPEVQAAIDANKSIIDDMGDASTLTMEGDVVCGLSSSDTLNRCPFCGSKAQEISDCGSGSYGAGWSYGIVCPKCQCKTTGHVTAGAAIIAWNMRAPSEIPSQALIERITKRADNSGILHLGDVLYEIEKEQDRSEISGNTPQRESSHQDDVVDYTSEIISYIKNKIPENKLSTASIRYNGWMTIAEALRLVGNAPKRGTGAIPANECDGLLEVIRIAANNAGGRLTHYMAAKAAIAAFDYLRESKRESIKDEEGHSENCVCCGHFLRMEAKYDALNKIIGGDWQKLTLRRNYDILVNEIDNPIGFSLKIGMPIMVQRADNLPDMKRNNIEDGASK